ncbi:MAG TPA: hypothetical protein VF941_14380, partial [Clostridia bacterium]
MKKNKKIIALVIIAIMLTQIFLSTGTVFGSSAYTNRDTTDNTSVGSSDEAKSKEISAKVVAPTAKKNNPPSMTDLEIETKILNNVTKEQNLSDKVSASESLDASANTPSYTVQPTLEPTPTANNKSEDPVCDTSASVNNNDVFQPSTSGIENRYIQEKSQTAEDGSIEEKSELRALPTSYKVYGYVCVDFYCTNSAVRKGFKVEIVGKSLSTTTDSEGYFVIQNV